MKKKRHSVYLTALAVLLASHSAGAQGTQEEFTLPEVVVTATKTELDIKEVPSAVQVITKEDIASRGAQTLKDVLRFATGVNLVRSSASPTREAISIRGFDSRFSMILIDGKRVSSEIDQNYELDRIPLQNIERIEIVRGPVSSLYGTEALGGVVNIITKRPEKQQMTVALDGGVFSGGSKGRSRYDFTYDSGGHDRLAVSLTGSYIENSALYKSNNLTYEPFGSRKNFDLGLDYKISDDETLRMTASYTKEDTHEFVKPGAVRLDAWDYTERDDQSIAYNRKLAKGNVFFRYYRSVMDKNLDQYNATTRALANWTKSKRTIEVYEGRFTKPYGDNHNVTYGAEYRPEVFRGTAVATGEGIFTSTHAGGQTKLGSTAKLNYTAAYAQDEWVMSPKWLAVTSLRYDDSNKFESNLSPKLGVTYTAASDVRIKLNIAKGFRSPTPNQLYQNTTTILGNPNLKSEKSKSYDLSIEKDFGKATGKLSYFYNDVTNLIDLTGSGVQKEYQNIRKAVIQGVEAEYTRPLTEKLSWSNSYTYLDAVDGSGQKLQNRARHMLASKLSYRDGGFTASLWAEGYQGYLISPGGSKTYSVWNLALSKRLNDTTKLIFGVDNIFNKKDEDGPVLGTYIHGGVQFSF